ncbi:DUF6098 family protein [Microbacterium sp. ZW T5_56]|uniref:DUF6098 family protein n=1 Tax=Microbacterium sp. ZW T5_56 TaxID=3378081 RepID=UPI00385230B1
MEALIPCRTLDELASLVRAHPTVYVRYSAGPRHDADELSIDGESGLELPGLSVNPLTPEQWWSRPLAHWLARQLMQYQHLRERDGAFGWVLTGREVGRGPDCEPLVVDVVPLARIADSLVTEADALYDRVFDRGALPNHRGDKTADRG